MGKTATLANIGSVADSSLGFRNRIINGAMVIDQRNAGASVTPTATGTYGVDRWCGILSAASKFSMQQSTTAPSNYKNSVLITSLSAYSVGAGDYFSFLQLIEGNNIVDLGWGTATAQSVTLSFWVRSSLTGTFGGALRNNASNRSYPFTYTISAANTWEQKSVTIAGDTTGTWDNSTNCGIQVGFGLGVGSTYSGTAGSWAAANYVSATGATSVVGTNGATFYITGVQLEKGATATSFDYRPYGTELALCQRYCQVFGSGAGTYENFGTGMTTSTTNSNVFFPYVVSMRTQPTVTTSGSFRVADFVNYSTTATIAINTDYTGLTAATFACTSTGLTSQRFAFLQANNDITARVKLSAEL